MKKYILGLCIFLMLWTQSLFAQSSASAIHKANTLDEFLALANNKDATCMLYQLDGWENDASEKGFKNFKVIENRVIFSEREHKGLLDLLNQKESYNVKASSLCEFTPDYGLEFDIEGRKIAVLMANDCQNWQFHLDSRRVTILADKQYPAFETYIATLFRPELANRENNHEVASAYISLPTTQVPQKISPPKLNHITRLKQNPLILMPRRNLLLPDVLVKKPTVIVKNITETDTANKPVLSSEQQKNKTTPPISTVKTYTPYTAESWVKIAETHGTKPHILKDGNSIPVYRMHAEANMPIVIYYEKKQYEVEIAIQLSAIAEKLQVSEQDLRRWNHLIEAENLIQPRTLIYFQ